MKLQPRNNNRANNSNRKNSDNKNNNRFPLLHNIDPWLCRLPTSEEICDGLGWVYKLFFAHATVSEDT